MRYLHSLPVFAILAACMAGCAPTTVNLSPETVQQLRSDNIALRQQVSDLQSSVNQLTYVMDHVRQDQDKVQQSLELGEVVLAANVGMQIPDFLQKSLPLLKELLPALGLKPAPQPAPESPTKPSRSTK